MFHFQNTVNDWPRAVAKLPDKCCIKAVDRGDILRDAKKHKPGIFTILRHWDDSLQHFDGNTDTAVLRDRARRWFASHIDGTFKQQYAPHVDAVSWYNEIWANSQTAAERAERIKATEAAVWVWQNEYRSQAEYKHIKLIIGEAAIGNDMPREIAKLAIDSGNIVGYHPYSLWREKARAANDFRDLSGRYNQMEQAWGLKPTWAFTEAGPFESVLDGWRSAKCLGANPTLYVDAVKKWIQDMQQTAAYKEGRILGFTLFTSGGGDKWKLYETKQPEMDMLADMIAAEWKPGTIVPPPPPPPAQDPCKPREGFNRKVTNVIPQTMSLEDAVKVFAQVWQESKETVSGSYDEAGLGPKELTRVAKLWAIPQVDRSKYTDWYNRHYPGTQVIFKDLAPTYQIIDVVDGLPKHATKRYKTRPLTDITTLTIHHTVSPCNRSTGAIAQYHVDSRDWPGIGYHYVIGCDGKIEQTNYNETISFHAGVAGHNNNEVSLGIALKDDFTDHPPTQAAQDAARWLVRHLREQFSDELEVLGHREMPGAQTQCPGDTYKQWLDYVAGR